jgi:biotin operon repressor
MRRMSEGKTRKLIELFISGMPGKEIAYQLELTPDAVALKITSLRKEGHNLPRRSRPTTNRGMKYRQRPDKRPVPKADWAMRRCLGPLCLGKRFNSPGPHTRVCPACALSNKLICDRIEA